MSPPPEPGLSSRVWLDAAMTQIGLAMARSIGDHAVKSIGVVAEPEVTTHTIEVCMSTDQRVMFLFFAHQGCYFLISFFVQLWPFETMHSFISPTNRSLPRHDLVLRPIYVIGRRKHVNLASQARAACFAVRGPDEQPRQNRSAIDKAG